MSEKVKIKISEEAYYTLMDILKEEDQYSRIRFSYKDGCCGSSKVELYLDNVKTGDIEETIDELPILYNLLVLENIKEITVVYRNGSFMIKTEMLKEQNKDCSSCTSGCGGKGSSSGGCSGCKKDGCH
jgi:Fe-S cluster assembly iron-binding protein IscA